MTGRIGLSHGYLKWDGAQEESPQCQDRDMGHKTTAAFCSGRAVMVGEGEGGLYFQPKTQE